MDAIGHVFQDWHANSSDGKGRAIMILFRFAQLLTSLPSFFQVLALPYFVFYRVGVEWFLGVELRRTTEVGAGLALYHAQALVVNDRTVIGRNCTLRHSTTIGNKSRGLNDSPRIGNNVDIGSNTVLIGAISIGDNAIIGAGSVVVKDVPAGATVAGNPARIIRLGENGVGTDA